eukprot:CAMPEP_0181205752 /NCGR_PEP_ID=MMETSP1096-20121128/20648_1 /TAXON_ID=156174 ORGANISM="Chrysochromulina ericina, Strain CCMP281" /NCGR_SAMPLE_ID=MMETSP1096 /ASSEMBLY_ACC=CAM_ASM_000453 /LENGTH=55 /DNA_ID=CAMNT_0023296563 /DNA_START=538 /DNA_END=705 /DNA_ORIENTATION=-
MPSLDEQDKLASGGFWLASDGPCLERSKPLGVPLGVPSERLRAFNAFSSLTRWMR